MNVLQRFAWIIVGVCLVLPMVAHGAGVTVQPLHKLILYPADGDTVAQLKASGVQQVTDYGSYWIVEATAAQVQALPPQYGGRLQPADHLNKLELHVGTIDTTVGEPAIPNHLKERATSGKRLRLVQFIGPVRREWLEQLQAIKNVKLVNYVPNNAYVVLLDATAETKLLALRQPAGPIQWIGTFQPYYKLNQALRQSTRATVKVCLAVVNDTDSTETIAAIKHYAIGPVAAPRYLLNQINFELTLLTGDLSLVAGLPHVLWVQEVMPVRRMDEAQALVLATSASGPPPTSYFDFLLNTVGISQNPLDYPVLDIADTGIDVTHPCFSLPTFPVVPVMSCASFFGSKIVYADSNDTEGHGTMVASVAVGYDNLPDETVDCWLEKKTSVSTTNLVWSCLTNNYTIGGGVECSGPVPPACCDSLTCTNFNITCGFQTNVTTVSSCTPDLNKTIPYPITIFRREFNSNLQLGLGISPYGRIGASLGGAEGGFLGPFDHARRIYLGINSPGGARISNNSWGDILVPNTTGGPGNGGAYTALSQAYDALVRDAVNTGSTNPPTPGPSPLNQELIYIFAGGNYNDTGSVGGFGEVLVTAPATAKNVLSVGATTKDDPGSLAEFTSFGPAADGRFKPEIMAPGVGIYAATSQDAYGHHQCGGCNPNNPGPPACVDGFTLYPAISLLYSFIENGITIADGTSFSAPAVSGGAQLLWWYFQNRLLMLQPSPAMVKAYICNSARYLPSPDPLTGATDQLPSSAQGMGRMDLDRMFDGVPRVVRDESESRAVDVALLTTNPVTQQTYFSASGQSYELSGTVADATKPFRVTLAWTDPPGDPINFVQLVNNLDLLVTIGGKTYYGNVFNGQFSKTGGTPDVLNNMESVFLPAGQTGAWSVVVRAVNIAGKGVPNIGTTMNQDFALVVYNGRGASDIPNPMTNDACQTAIDISAFPLAWTNNLTAPVYHHNHLSPTAGQGGLEEFFSITYPTPGTKFTVNTFGSKFNTLLSVWRGTCGGLEEVVSNNDSSNTTQSAVSWTVTDTNTYYIVAGGFQKNTGKLVLNVQATPPPFGFASGGVFFGTNAMDFGTNYIGATTSLTVTLQNQTSVRANIASLSLGGPNAGDFSISADNCSGLSIPPGGTCDITLGFSPLGAGLRNATLMVADDITGSPQTLALKGFGLVQIPLNCLSTSAGLSFGTVLIGTNSAPQSMTITNCGTANLFVTNIVPSTADYTVGSDTCSGQSIAPGDTCLFNVIFTPTATGQRPATLMINDNTSTSPHQIGLLGSGQARTPQICLPASVNLGSVDVGTSTNARLIVINCGTADLVISNLVIDGDSAFSLNMLSSPIISMGSTGTIMVQFAPPKCASAAAVLQIIDNAHDSPQLVTLAGIGKGSQADLAISLSRTWNLKKLLGYNRLTPPLDLTNQTLKATGARGKKLVFYLPIWNQGTWADAFLIQGGGSTIGTYTDRLGTGTYTNKVRYFLGALPKDSLDITSAVTAGTYSTATLGVGGYTGLATMLRLEITVDKHAPAGPIPITVKATPATRKYSSQNDSVQLKLTVK